MRRSRFVVVLSLLLTVALGTTLLPMMQVRAGAGGFTITVDKATIVNDGVDAATLTFTVTDDGNPVPDGTTITFATSPSDPGIVLSTTSTTTTGGEASVSVSSNLPVATVSLIQVTATYAEAACTSACTSDPFDIAVLDAALPSEALSTISATPATIAADGTATSTIEVTLLNAVSDPIAGVNVTLTANVAGPTVNVVNGTTDANGVATFTTSWLNRDLAASQVVTYTTGTITGAEGDFTKFIDVTFTTPALPADGPSTVSAAPTTILANNVQTSTVTVTLLNAANAPVVGKTVSLAETTAVGGLTIAPASAGSEVTNASGVATFTVRGTNVGAATLQATDVTDTIVLAADTVTVTLESALPAEGPSTVSATPLTILANNVQTSTVTVTLLSAGGNPVPGKTVTLTDTAALGGLTIAPASVGSEVTNASGIATFTVRGSVAGTAILQATDTTDGITLTNDQVTITLASANPAEGPTTVSAAPSSIPADNTTTSIVTVTLRNALSNPVQGKTVTLLQTTTLTGVTITDVQPVSDVNGVATFSVRGNTVGTATFRATDVTDGIDFSNDLVTITFNPPPADAGLSTVTTDKTTVIANNTDTATITVTLRDAANQPLQGKQVNLQASGSTSGLQVNNQPYPASNVTTNAAGVATFVVKANTALGGVTFTANDISDGILLSGDTVTINFIAPGADKTQTTVSVSKTSVFANGTDSATITVTVRDSSGFPIPNKQVALNSVSFPNGITLNDQTPGSVTPVNTNGNGNATFVVKSTVLADNVVFTFQITTDGIILDDPADRPSISFVQAVPTNTPSNTPTMTATGPTPTSTGAPTTSAIFSTVYCNYSQAPADGVFKVSILISLRDQNNQPVPNHFPVPSVIPPTAGLSFSSPALTDINGNVTYFVSSVTQTAPNAVLISITDQTASPPVVLAQTCTIIFGAPGSTPVAGATPIGGLTTTPIGTPFGTPTATPTAGLMNANSEGEITGIVVAYRLRVRTGPGLNYEILGLLRYKVTIVLLGRNRAGTWLLTQLDDGRQVWVSSRWIRISRARFRRLPLIDVPPRTPAQPIATPSLRPIVNPASYSVPSEGSGIGMVNVSTLDAYIAPSQSSIIVATLPRNTELLVRGKSEDNNWYYVEVDGNKLWVPATYVSLRQINGTTLGVVNPLSAS